MAEKTEKNPKGAGAPEGHTNSSKNNRIWGNIIKKETRGGRRIDGLFI